MRKIDIQRVREIGFAILLMTVVVGIPTESILIEAELQPSSALPFAALATLLSAGVVLVSTRSLS